MIHGYTISINSTNNCDEYTFAVYTSCIWEGGIKNPQLLKPRKWTGPNQIKTVHNFHKKYLKKGSLTISLSFKIWTQDININVYKLAKFNNLLILICRSGGIQEEFKYEMRI